jgi:hypothetical protein
MGGETALRRVQPVCSNVSMATEDELRDVMLEILKVGILNSRSAGWDEDPERAAREADHIHNLPDVARTPRLELASTYYNVHRIDFMKQVRNFVEFEPLWSRLEEILVRMRAEQAA